MRAAQGFEELESAYQIVLKIVGWILDRRGNVCVRCKVKDHIKVLCLEQIFEGPAKYIEFTEINLFGDALKVLQCAVGEIINHRDSDPRLDEDLA